MKMAGKNEYDRKLIQFMTTENVEAEHLPFQQSCHSVAEAAAVVGCEATDFVKNICMVDGQDNLIVAIVKGEDRASTSEVARHLNIESVRTARPEEILNRTGYPCGGTPSFGYIARFLIDPRVMEKSLVYTGGGSEQSLVRIAPQEMQKANGGEVAKIRK
jgi:Cys-tRNA(Pro)/Cys-tRNA(Cys) deacylase